MELENYQTKTGQTSISLLVENFPEAAEVALNQCVHHSPHLKITDPEYTVTYDFKYLDPGPEVKKSSKRFSTVKTMIKHQRERLLLHPLTLKFNERKWSTLGKFGFFGDFFTYFILLVLLSIFIVKQRGGVDLSPQSPPNMTTSGESYVVFGFLALRFLCAIRTCCFSSEDIVCLELISQCILKLSRRSSK